MTTRPDLDATERWFEKRRGIICAEDEVMFRALLTYCRELEEQEKLDKVLFDRIAELEEENKRLREEAGRVGSSLYGASQ